MTSVQNIGSSLQKLITHGSVVNPRTGTRASAIVGKNYVAKIVLPGENTVPAQKLGVTRIIREYLPGGKSNIKVDFDVPCSLKGGWGGLRTIEGTVDQIKKTFQYLYRVVNENCNTLTALENLELVRKICPNVFANVK